MKILPFDAHNHVHLGPSPPELAFLSKPEVRRVHHENNSGGGVESSKTDPSTASCTFLSGMALMSTHPRDFPVVRDLVTRLPEKVNDDGDDDAPAAAAVVISQPLHVVPCYGVHPWFLHELNEKDWESITTVQQQRAMTTTATIKIGDTSATIGDTAATPTWLHDMEQYLQSDPAAIVGEIGLDGFHFDPVTKDLVSSMEGQVQAFELQLQLAHDLQRAVSIHTVQCFGPLMETLSTFKKQKQLPPKHYFHAFGGKVGTVDQLLALCGREIGQVYFGFAPIINFKSPKTADVVRRVGLERILLESDHEDADCVAESMRQGISFMAECFQVDEDTVVRQTTQNAYDFYGIK
mmetsp:Transcript_13443/g.17535  ORF Transcript_13443/g.17535 Transcript_13443/m.17535 type:complete len:350 (-) Transcript_13443:147-1196(-)|eukprot:CAMPEP_0198150268 /NCGR_PEP_ID=MMETSP1443-20131203/50141_1 /TAXON_ID=186043 /ORGANISM="Entomoneis sp., Strain CCMP2396" /LENGTH=349 /DNA_ID=CAMNT_0043815533 /DNA_START=55 /DNA_END=1104 /DNA_ORIENTATION=-